MHCSPSSASAEAPTLAAAAAALVSGTTSSEALTAAAIERIDDPAGQGRVACLTVDRAGALAAARASDALRRAGIVPSPLAGLPVSVKDLFDVAGETTTAGSLVLADNAPARSDAAAVARLRAAGAVLLGRTNMTEFAFSGLGLNPHYGTPLAPYDRELRRIAGGSSSGAAVSVAEGMAHAALGTDTGGSLRICHSPSTTSASFSSACWLVLRMARSLKRSRRFLSSFSDIPLEAWMSSTST